MAKAAGKKRITIISAIQGKLTYDCKVCELDVVCIIEKWRTGVQRSEDDASHSSNQAATSR